MYSYFFRICLLLLLSRLFHFQHLLFFFLTFHFLSHSVSLSGTPNTLFLVLFFSFFSKFIGTSSSLHHRKYSCLFSNLTVEYVEKRKEWKEENENSIREENKTRWNEERKGARMVMQTKYQMKYEKKKKKKY